MGQFLLLVVGDGIREGVERMAEFLSKVPQLGFTSALVEIALFRPSEKQEPLFVQPRVVARTREVVRAIVEVRAAAGTTPDVVVRGPDEGAGMAARVITEREFYLRLTTSAGPEAVDLVRRILQVAPAHGLEVTWMGRHGPGLRYVHDEPDLTFKLARFHFDGSLAVGVGKVAPELEKAGVPAEIAREYVEETRSLLGGVIAGSQREGRPGSYPVACSGDRPMVQADRSGHQPGQ